MKRILAAILSLVLVLGCVSFASAEETTIRMTWWGSQTRHDLTMAAVNKFMEKYPEIKVEVEYTDWGGYWSKLATQVAGGVEPDVIAMDYAYLTQYADNNVLADLTPYYDNGMIDISDAAASMIESGKVDGIPYAIPTGSNALVWMYRPDVLEAAGLTMPEKMTQEELIEMFRVVYEKTGRTQNAPISQDNVRNTARGFGGNLYNDEGTALGFDDPEVLSRMWENYNKGLEEGWQLPVGEGTAATEFDELVSDVWMISNWTNTQSAHESGSGCELKMLPWTDWSDATQASTYFKPSMFWCITERSANKDAAAALINFFENDPDCFDIIGLDRAMPISSKIRAHIAPNLSEDDQEIVAIMDYLSQEGNSTPIMKPDIVAHADVITLMNEYTEQVQYGLVDDLTAHAQAFIDEANEIIAKSLEK